MVIKLKGKSRKRRVDYGDGIFDYENIWMVDGEEWSDGGVMFVSESTANSYQKSCRKAGIDSKVAQLPSKRGYVIITRE
jgi:hypothetical protein